MAPPKKGQKTAGPSGRNLKVRVKTAKRRKTSSTRWLQRQLNDPYVQAAQRDGYRSRAAYKLTELDDKYKILKPGQHVVDLGAAPGGWTQVAVERLKGKGVVVAMDIAEIDNIAGAEVMQGDIMDLDFGQAIRNALGGTADVVLSDMAPHATGHRATDHLRIVGLVEAAADLAQEILSPGGTFVAKVWEGGADSQLLVLLKKKFTTVKHAKPKASRSGSAEMYLVATGYRG